MQRFTERTNYNKVITVKLVIPSGCNARCVFCYLKGYKDKLQYDDAVFKDSFISSLDAILRKLAGCRVSLDITGNEPTLRPELLTYVMDRLREYGIKDKVERVTITTNGTNLIQVCDSFRDVVNYVNISIHDFDPVRRKKIIGILPCTDKQYAEAVHRLAGYGITVSGIAVIHKDIPLFRSWVDQFIDYLKGMGFIGLRLRCSVFWDRKDLFDRYMDYYFADSDYTTIVHENTPDSHWARFRRNDKFRLFFLQGVEDTSMFTKGIEYIIADDGKLYVDYFKNTTLDEYEKSWTVGKIYDRVDLSEN